MQASSGPLGVVASLARESGGSPLLQEKRHLAQSPAAWHHGRRPPSARYRLSSSGWFVASLVSFVVVALFDFVGGGVNGVPLAFVATQSELHSRGKTGGSSYGAVMIRHLFASQVQSVQAAVCHHSAGCNGLTTTRHGRRSTPCMPTIGGATEAGRHDALPTKAIERDALRFLSSATTEVVL
jgi:hypothetical protein